MDMNNINNEHIAFQPNIKTEVIELPPLSKNTHPLGGQSQVASQPFGMHHHHHHPAPPFQNRMELYSTEINYSSGMDDGATPSSYGLQANPILNFSSYGSSNGSDGYGGGGHHHHNGYNPSLVASIHHMSPNPNGQPMIESTPTTPSTTTNNTPIFTYQIHQNPPPPPATLQSYSPHLYSSPPMSGYPPPLPSPPISHTQDRYYEMLVQQQQQQQHHQLQSLPPLSQELHTTPSTSDYPFQPHMLPSHTRPPPLPQSIHQSQHPSSHSFTSSIGGDLLYQNPVRRPINPRKHRDNSSNVIFSSPLNHSSNSLKGLFEHDDRDDSSSFIGIPNGANQFNHHHGHNICNNSNNNHNSNNNNNNNSVNNSNSSVRKGRWRPTPVEKEMLESLWLANQYPDKVDKLKLVQRLNNSISIEQVSRWFKHKRENLAQKGEFKYKASASKKFTPEEVKILDIYFKTDPYPGQDQIKSIADELDVPPHKIKNWFKSKRQKLAQKGEFEFKPKTNSHSSNQHHSGSISSSNGNGNSHSQIIHSNHLVSNHAIQIPNSNLILVHNNQIATTPIGLPTTTITPNNSSNNNLVINDDSTDSDSDSNEEEIEEDNNNVTNQNNNNIQNNQNSILLFNSNNGQINSTNNYNNNSNNNPNLNTSIQYPGIQLSSSTSSMSAQSSLSSPPHSPEVNHHQALDYQPSSPDHDDDTIPTHQYIYSGNGKKRTIEEQQEFETTTSTTTASTITNKKSNQDNDQESSEDDEENTFLTMDSKNPLSISQNNITFTQSNNNNGNNDNNHNNSNNNNNYSTSSFSKFNQELSSHPHLSFLSTSNNNNNNNTNSSNGNS